jgi:hypothetical protein
MLKKPFEVIAIMEPEIQEEWEWQPEKNLTIEEMIESIDSGKMRNDPNYKLWNSTALIGRDE